MNKRARIVYLLILAASLIVTLALLLNLAMDRYNGVALAGFDAAFRIISLLLFGSMTVTGIATCKDFRLPGGFLLVVIGAFFLGSGTTTGSPGGEIDVAFGLSCALAGYLLVYDRAKNVYIEVSCRSTEEQRRETLNRLAEARIEPMRRGFRTSPAPLPLP
jgi:hypothetical protein